MELLCCFKIVADLDKVVARDWDSAPIPGPDISYVRKVISCYDEAGLETALRIKDSAEKSGNSVSLTAVTLGYGSYDYFFRSLFALGFQRIVQIRLPEPVVFAAERVSSAICQVFADRHFDAVICGVQSADSSGGTTPYLLAKKIGIPCIPNVIDMSYQNGALHISRETAHGESAATIKTAAVFAIGNSTSPYLRMATVKKRLAASAMCPEIVEAAALAPSCSEGLELLGFSKKKGNRSCVFVEGDTCMEKAENFLKLCPEVRKA